MTARILLRFALLLGLVMFSACSSFEVRWKAAATSATATRWEGRWTSEQHLAPGGGPAGGRLRCVLNPTIPAACSGGTSQLRANFHAHWLIFASSYTMKLTPVPGSRTDFRGSYELPKIFGGTYRYEARLVGDQWTARYTSSYDHGTFTLQRVRLSKDCFPTHARH